MPATLSLINTLYAAGPQRNRALAVWSMASAGGLAAGALLGGLLTAAGFTLAFFVRDATTPLAFVPAGILVALGLTAAASFEDGFGRRGELAGGQVDQAELPFDAHARLFGRGEVDAHARILTETGPDSRQVPHRFKWLLGRGLPPLHMAINLSFRQFQDSQLLSTLGRLIEERGVDAQWLEFELTETAVMRRSEQVRQTMQALGRLGVRFSLDDFGTGFSSFVHLNNLPITQLKIDKSFVAGMGERAENRQLVRAMINLAHNLHLEVVAEGVENAEQLALLRQFGCDQVQGYLISKPLPLAELARFLVFGLRQPLLGGLQS